jgi:hypothetical protein
MKSQLQKKTNRSLMRSSITTRESLVNLLPLRLKITKILSSELTLREKMRRLKKSLPLPQLQICPPLLVAFRAPGLPEPCKLINQ